MTNHLTRAAEWGHWGITLSWKDGGYAPVRIVGTIYFPVGFTGPADHDKTKWRGIVADWQSRGLVPSGLVDFDAERASVLAQVTAQR